jgi:predicted RNA methylase
MVTIPDDAADVLRRGTWEGPVFKLPPGQLDRKLYEAVDKALRALGGKWNRGKAGHVFDAAAEADLRGALDAGGVVDQKKTLEQFFTPAKLAKRLATVLGIGAEDRVLEPSAGAGALIRAVLDRGGKVEVANELDAKLAAQLREDFTLDDVAHVAQGDFLQSRGSGFNVVIMNPPFSAGKDMAHVLHAYSLLPVGGRLGAIMSPHWTFANDKASADFRAWRNRVDADWTDLPAGEFKAEGTGVATGILVVTKPVPLA